MWVALRHERSRMTLAWNREWPLLTDYCDRRLARVALPLGGIGTGTVSLGGRGNLQDWEIMNTPALGYNGGHAVFILWTRPQGGEASARALEGALQPPFEGQSGSTASYHGLPRFRECAFGAAYPLGQVLLSDPACPLDVRLEAFNPLVPGDPETSGIPMAALRYVLHNPSAVPIEASITGYMHNMIGADGREGRCQGNQTVYRQDQVVRGLWMTSEGVPTDAPQWGTIALTTDGQDLSYCTGGEERSWGGRLLALWDDIMDDGRLEDRQGPPTDALFSGLCSSLVVPPASETTVTFLLTWVFPNRPAWSRTPVAPDACECCGPTARVGNYYATRYADAWNVAERVMPRLPALERQTLVFLDAFCGSDLPAVVKEAALYNVSTLRTQTCFRTEDGRFYGWEGCCDDHGCCMGSCTHVWNYEQATAYLFGSLARSMREIEFLHATNDDGRMSFRVSLPLGRDAEFPVAAADGQMGCILKAYREWQLLGDDEWLRALWPQVKRALAYAWVPGGWDADQDGVMEGCQHNTLDVEYYGPNPLMAGWYLGALRAAERMARHLGDEVFAERCGSLAERGSAWVDAHLYNGEFYEQIVQPAAPGQEIAEGLRHDMGASDPTHPDYQLGPGCLVDQLAGQFMAHVCGLGHLLNREHVRAALASIYRHNHREELYGHFNHMRSFALSDESALLMCTWPHGGRPEVPVPYGNEVMTGFEYTAAIHMLYEEMTELGLRCIADIRARYDGERRNPFDEAECGHHYARAMASWAAVLALSGFSYSAVTGEMVFAARAGHHFWSNGDAWGTCLVREVPSGLTARLEVLYGRVRLSRLRLGAAGHSVQADDGGLVAGQSVTITVAIDATSDTHSDKGDTR